MHILPAHLIQNSSIYSRTHSSNTSKRHCQNNNNKIFSYSAMPPVFKENNKFSNVHYVFSDSIENPMLTIEVAVKKTFEHKQGILPIYELALHQKMQKLKSQKNNYNTNNFFYDGIVRKTELTCNQEKFLNLISSAPNTYININLTQEDIEQAKKIAEAAYYIRTNDFYSQTVDFDDTPTGLNSDEYHNFVDSITLNDLQKYSNDRFKNSEINLVLYSNKQYFNANKNTLIPLLNSIAQNKNL